MRLNSIIYKVNNVYRLSKEDVLYLYNNCSLLELGALARNIRIRQHPEDIVTYIIDRNINYTNICISGCKFCAFFKKIGEKGGYLISLEELDKKINETKALGGQQILLQGGMHPELDITYYERLFNAIKTRHDIHIHALSPPEILHISRISRLDVHDTILRLKQAGLDSIPGGGAEILVDDIRYRLSPKKCSSAEWLYVMAVAHSTGLKTTATMMFGHIESVGDRIAHLLKIRELQDKTRGFTAFIPWTYQEVATLNVNKMVTASEYLKTLAISRLCLDNIANIQASWVTQGSKVGQLALQFGANDMGSVMIEENVVKAAGTSYTMSEDEIISLIKSAGYIPCRRNFYYNKLYK